MAAGSFMLFDVAILLLQGPAAIMWGKETSLSVTEAAFALPFLPSTGPEYEGNNLTPPTATVLAGLQQMLK